ncbi:hypothetical protein T310_6624, partial [Rasamsonia emersonii CBS 393.64]
IDPIEPIDLISRTLLYDFDFPIIRFVYRKQNHGISLTSIYLLYHLSWYNVVLYLRRWYLPLSMEHIDNPSLDHMDFIHDISQSRVWMIDPSYLCNVCKRRILRGFLIKFRS